MEQTWLGRNSNLARVTLASKKNRRGRLSSAWEFPSSRTVGENIDVDAMTNSYSKRPYAGPECNPIDRTDLAVLVRNKLLKHREVQAYQTRNRGIRSVLLVEDSRSKIANLEQSGELNGTKRIHKEAVNGIPLHHLAGPPFINAEHLRTDVLLLDLRSTNVDKLSVLAEISARQELAGIPLVILISSAADSLSIRGSDFQGNHSFTGPVTAEYFEMALDSFVDLWSRV